MEPSIRFRHLSRPVAGKRTTEKADIQPILWRTGTIANQESSSEETCCGVCLQNKSRYICPRCFLPYCSVACYREHSTDKETQCTEKFYENKVQEVLKAETASRTNEFRSMLSRIYREHQQSTDHALNNIDTFGDVSSNNDLSQKELIQVLRVLETGDEAAIEELVSSERIRRGLSDSLQSDNLQDWLLKPWKPWWEENTAIDVETHFDDDEPDLIGCKTLDDWIVSAPQWENVRPNTAGLADPQLHFNIVDLLYAMASTFRLYHGPVNARESDVVGAAHMLMQSSRVLSQNAHYESVMEALTESVRLSSSRVEENIWAWTFLAADTSLIARNQRYTLRCFFEAIALIRAAEHESKEKRNSLRRARKKLLFYIAWIRDHQDLIESIPSCIDEYVATYGSIATED